MEQNKAIGKKSSLNIASTLCWILGILYLLGGSHIGIINFTSKPLIFSLGLLTITNLISGLALCVAGYGLRKRKKYAGVIAIIFSLLIFISRPIYAPPIIGLILGIFIIIFIAKNWKELS